jgi:transcriptional regulator with XRE-family HTH domain
MTAPLLSAKQAESARVVAREIGAAIRRERLSRGDRLQDLREYLGLKSSCHVSQFERGTVPNLMLGTALRYLAVYNLTLAVVPMRKSES